MVGLGSLPGRERGHARATSANGAVVVGQGYSHSGGGASEAFRWTEAGGMVGLGFLPGAAGSAAHDVSSDGSVVVGGSSNEAFRWTEAGGMVGLGDLPGGDFSSIGIATSADGSVVVGNSSSASGDQVFRWTEATGMIGLGSSLSGDVLWSRAGATSADGTVIAGEVAFEDSYAPHVAFRWTPHDGMRSVQEVLTADFGLDLTGWYLVQVGGVSADGVTFTGSGYNPDGRPEAWIATIPIPEPASLAFLSLGSLALLRRRR